jgi:hypothetical protein
MKPLLQNGGGVIIIMIGAALLPHPLAVIAAAPSTVSAMTAAANIPRLRCGVSRRAEEEERVESIEFAMKFPNMLAAPSPASRASFAA